MVRNGTTAGSLRIYSTLVLLSVLALFTGACRSPVQPEISGNTGTILLYPDPDPVVFSYQSDQPVLTLDFGNFSQKTIILRNAAGRQAMLVKINSSLLTIPGTATGTAGTRSLTVDTDSEDGRQEHEAALLFNANPPPIPQEAAPRSLSRSISYGEPNPAYVLDSKKDFKVEKADGTWTSIPATLRAIGQYSYIWVADASHSTSSTIGDNKITTSQAGLLRDKFDGTIGADYKDGVFRNVSTIFGYEYGGGDSGNGGRDGDQHISILVYDIDFDYSANQTGGVFGYFWSKDFYTQAQLDSHYASNYPPGVPVPQTNYAEIFYLDAHFADRYPEAIYSTLAHEYQHMIHFNMKTVRLGRNSAIWFNEMCSMVAEDLVLGNIGLNPVSAGPQSRLNVFAYHYAESGLSDWLSGNEVLKSYAGAFAFGAYLARNFGSAGFFRELMHNNKVNEEAISAAMAAAGAVGNGKGFSQELLRYSEALVLTASPAVDGLRSLNKEATSFITVGTAGDYIKYTATPIDLGSIQQYNLGTNKLVNNRYGLRRYLPSEAIELRPYGISIHTQDSWVADGSGDLELILEAPADSAVRLFLIVR